MKMPMTLGMEMPITLGEYIQAINERHGGDDMNCNEECCNDTCSQYNSYYNEEDEEVQEVQIGTFRGYDGSTYVAVPETHYGDCTGCDAHYDNGRSEEVCFALGQHQCFESRVIWKKIETKPVGTDPLQGYDSVHKPKHYMLLQDKGVEVRDVCKAMAQRLQAKNYPAMLISDYIQALQYMLRFDQKGAAKQDLEKCKWYLDKLLEELS
jgi:hypothetical protein